MVKMISKKNIVHLLIACFTLFLTFLVFVNCEKTSNTGKEPILLNPNRVKYVDDTSLLSQYTLTCADSGLIAIDSPTNKIHQFDYNSLEHINSFGKEGRGPKEFLGIYHSAIHEENLFAYDSGNQRVHILNQHDLSYQSAIPIRFSATRFAASSDALYAAMPFSDNQAPFLKVSIKDASVSYFGEWIKNNFPGRNLFHFLLYKNRLIAVSYTEPIIKIYDLFGKLISRFDISNEVILSGSLKFAENVYSESENQLRSVILFRYASIYNDFIILNLIRHDEGSHDENAKYNNYLVYKIDNDQIEKTAFFRTNNGTRGVTTTFCIHNDRLYSNGSPDRLDIYEFDISFLNQSDNQGRFNPIARSEQ